MALSWKWYFEKFCFPASFFRVFFIQLFHSLRLKLYFSFEIGITGAVSRQGGKAFVLDPSMSLFLSSDYDGTAAGSKNTSLACLAVSWAALSRAVALGPCRTSIRTWLAK